VGRPTSQGWLSGRVQHASGRSADLAPAPSTSRAVPAHGGGTASRGREDTLSFVGDAQPQRSPRPQSGGVSGWMSPVNPAGGGSSSRLTGPPWAVNRAAM
ncbi:unnamed protein product, partial [Scytosiphon promiscuus]